MTEWLYLALATALTLGTSVFVAAEFSLVALDRPAVQRVHDEGDARAGSVLTSLRQLSTQLSAAQVGITLTTLVVGYLAQPSIGALLSRALAGLGWSEGVLATVTGLAALLLATVFSMVVGELVPQFLGISAPLPTAKVVAGPVRFFSTVARPLIAVLNGSANAALRGVGIEPQEELSGARTPQELASLVRRSAAAGVLDADTARLLTRSLDFGDRTALDVMTPRPQCVAVERTATAADLIELARGSGLSRFPVLDEDWDDVDGIVHLKRAVAVPVARRAKVPVSALMDPALLVPETIRLHPLLVQLRVSGLQLAVVIDEHGGTSGVVSLEDVVEELVGDVSDEHDVAAPAGQALQDGTWALPAQWRPDEVRNTLGALVPDGVHYETIGGFVMAALGRIPAVGDAVAIPGWTIQVAAMDGRRVDRVRFVPVPAAEPVMT
jgi:CBS domain containing-hemolysin-like protein